LSWTVFLCSSFLSQKKVNICLIFFGDGRKKNGPTQLENRLGFRGELMEFNHSLALVFYWFSFLVQKKENIHWLVSLVFYWFFIPGPKKRKLCSSFHHQKKKVNIHWLVSLVFYWLDRFRLLSKKKKTIGFHSWSKKKTSCSKKTF
jgi:hypothetical protein